MLFPYRSFDYPIKRIQEWIDHLFLEVWCREEGAFSLELLHEELHVVVDAVEESKRIKKKLLDVITRIDNACGELRPEQREQLRAIYRTNNAIEALCQDPTHWRPMRYEELKELFPKGLCEDLKDFFESIYTTLIDYTDVKKQAWNTSLEDYYKEFVNVKNKTGVCPFCGLADLKSGHNARDPFDHYLPKALYIFNAINFDNLVPMCGTCNSSYKLGKDTLYEEGNRRVAFYPFREWGYRLEVVLTLNTCDIEGLQEDNIHVEITAGEAILTVEIRTWMNIFNIAARYAEKCVNEASGKSWFRAASNKYYTAKATNRKLEDSIWMEWYLMDKMDENPNLYSDTNFLKYAFLRACLNAGSFRASK